MTFLWRTGKQIGKNKYAFIPVLFLIYCLEITFFCVKWTMNYEQSERGLNLCACYLVGNLLATLVHVKFENLLQPKAVACLPGSRT
jgi:hypothetical protein